MAVIHKFLLLTVVWISYLYIAVTKLLDRNGLKAEMFALAHGFRGIRPSEQRRCGGVV